MDGCVLLLSQPICDFLHTLVAEYNECEMYMYDRFRTTVNKLYQIIKKECFT